MLGRREGCIAHAQERAGFSRLMRARGGQGRWRVPACLPACLLVAVEDRARGRSLPTLSPPLSRL